MKKLNSILPSLGIMVIYIALFFIIFGCLKKSNGSNNDKECFQIIKKEEKGNIIYYKILDKETEKKYLLVNYIGGFSPSLAITPLD